MRYAVQLSTLRRYAAQVCRSTWNMNLAVLMAVAVAACSGSATPSAPPTTNGTPTTTAAPPRTVSTSTTAETTSEAEPTTSGASATTTLDAQAALQAEAVEAVKAYYDAWNRAILSRDSSELRAMSLPQCGGCATYVEDIDQLRTKNQTARGGLITLESLKALPGAESGIGVQGTSVRAPVQILSNKGTVVTSYAAEKTVGRLWVLARSGGRLKIKAIS